MTLLGCLPMFEARRPVETDPNGQACSICDVQTRLGLLGLFLQVVKNVEPPPITKITKWVVNCLPRQRGKRRHRPGLFLVCYHDQPCLAKCTGKKKNRYLRGTKKPAPFGVGICFFCFCILSALHNVEYTTA